MGFVVKVDFATGDRRWLTSPRRGGVPAFGPREIAQVFRTESESQAAIDTVRQTSPGDGVTFRVEAAE
jgi:hypothetical protein